MKKKARPSLFTQTLPRVVNQRAADTARQHRPETRLQTDDGDDDDEDYESDDESDDESDSESREDENLDEGLLGHAVCVMHAKVGFELGFNVRLFL